MNEENSERKTRVNVVNLNVFVNSSPELDIDDGEGVGGITEEFQELIHQMASEETYTITNISEPFYMDEHMDPVACKELIFKIEFDNAAVDQEDDKVLNTVNQVVLKMIEMFTGYPPSYITLDWRDDETLWVWVHRKNEEPNVILPEGAPVQQVKSPI